MGAYRVVLSLVEAHVSVQDLDEELHLQGRVHALIGNLQSFLQALHHPLAISNLQSGQRHETCMRGHTHRKTHTNEHAFMFKIILEHLEQTEWLKIFHAQITGTHNKGQNHFNVLVVYLSFIHLLFSPSHTH